MIEALPRSAGPGTSARSADPGPRPRRPLRPETIGLSVLLVGTAVAYLWDLSATGYANSFYAAAVQAGAHSWKAFFFGSLDSSNFITVDKPPASLWVMDLSARIFGFGSFSMLAPQALEGVAAVALLYFTVKRWFGVRAGLVAGAVLATMPVGALMFRYDNPDALLTLLLTAGAYCTVRAINAGSGRWLAAAGMTVGLAFLAKMGEALLVVPGIALAYAVAAPVSLRRRALHLVAGGAAMIAAAGWWVLAVELWPASSRPMIDGSPTNSIWNLIVAYNGLARISGQQGPGSNFSGAPGVLRLFNTLMAGQASWLLPAALLSLVGILVANGLAPRTDRARAAALLWGGWLVAAGAVFSLGRGVIHTYYTVALAPPIAALVGLGGVLLWKSRHRPAARMVAAAAVAGTAVWSVILLDRTAGWNSWLRLLVGGTGVVAVAGLVGSFAVRRPGRLLGLAAAAASVTGLGGPAAYTIATVATPHDGPVVSAGPALLTASGRGSLRGPGPSTGGPQGAPFGPGTAGAPGGGPAGGAGFPAGGFGAPPGLGGSAFGPPPGAPGGSAASAAPAGGAAGAGAGGGQVSSALARLLSSGSGHYRWAAATFGSQSAASLELATGGLPVMAIGGFNGQGGNISLAAFQAYASAGDIHYFIAGGAAAGGGGPGGAPGGGPAVVGPGRAASATSAITQWVSAHFRSVTVGGQMVYDLTQRSLQ